MCEESLQLAILPRLYWHFATGAQGNGNKPASNRLVSSDGSNSVARNVHALTNAKDAACRNSDPRGIYRNREAFPPRQCSDRDPNPKRAENADDRGDEPRVEPDDESGRESDKGDEDAAQDHRYVNVDARLQYHG